MRISIIGAGPTGLVLAGALARRGHRIDLVERDAGPQVDGTWPRRGVLQFHHAHAVRPQVAEVLIGELPDAHTRWLAAGAEPITATIPGVGEVLMGTRSRRETLERAIRTSVESESAVTFRVGHVDTVTRAGGRATGLKVDGAVLSADLVINASGRSSRILDGLPPVVEIGGPCGIAYVDRQYKLRPGAEPGPLTSPIAWQAVYDGYQVIVFPHEQGIFSVLFVRPTAGNDFVALRADAVFDAASRTVPGLREWTDPHRSQPITPVLPGGALHNHYRSQRGRDGGLQLPGLISIGDAVCTTTPNFGRGLALSMMQVRALLDLLDHHSPAETQPIDAAALDIVTEKFDSWCESAIRPWVEDHITMDAALVRRWSGADIDLSASLPSDRILAAGEIDAVITRSAMPYLAMTAGPAAVRALEPLARAVYATGWRPRPTDGPTRAELAATIRAATAA
jgi:2-polyprenyl-6-methoxyphenol hydroxylase-like FAD-dependent oxidoreductase